MRVSGFMNAIIAMRYLVQRKGIAVYFVHIGQFLALRFKLWEKLEARVAVILKRFKRLLIHAIFLGYNR